MLVRGDHLYSAMMQLKACDFLLYGFAQKTILTSLYQRQNQMLGSKTPVTARRVHRGIDVRVLLRLESSGCIGCGSVVCFRGPSSSPHTWSCAKHREIQEHHHLEAEGLPIELHQNLFEMAHRFRKRERVFALTC